MNFYCFVALCLLFTVEICVTYILGANQDVDWDPSVDDVEDLYSVFQELDTDDLDKKANGNQFHDELTGPHVGLPLTGESIRSGREKEMTETESKATKGRDADVQINAMKRDSDDDARSYRLWLNNLDTQSAKTARNAERQRSSGKHASPSRPKLTSLKKLLRKAKLKHKTRQRNQKQKGEISKKTDALPSQTVTPAGPISETSVAVTNRTTQGKKVTSPIPLVTDKMITQGVPLVTDTMITQGVPLVTDKMITQGVLLVTDTMITQGVSGGPKTYGFHIFYRDHSAWVGAIIGIMSTISLIVMVFAACKVILKYRRCKGTDIKDLSFSPFKDHKLDKSPMYIRLSHIKNPKTGNHYVVSVLDDKKDEENEWSSEEEVFNISAVKPGFGSPGSKTASPSVNGTTPVETSTPFGTPIRHIRKDK